jgi:hypothetical protein
MLLAVAVLPRGLWAVGECNQDRAKYCSTVTPAKRAVHACMLAHQTALTPACRDRVLTAEALLQKFKATCQDDARRFCARQQDVQTNDLVDCIKRNSDKFSSSCKDIYHELKAMQYPIFK